MALAVKGRREEAVPREGALVSGGLAVGGVLKAALQAKPEPSEEKQASALEKEVARDEENARKFYAGAIMVAVAGVAGAVLGVAAGAAVAVVALAAIVAFNFYSDYASSKKEARIEELRGKK
ncbi:MAG: hypothetical protein PHF51_03610 [Candidatus ainarchaeum sp.]|nr:hypothetical protein [Candidatus ainarchaeum sp.]